LSRANLINENNIKSKADTNEKLNNNNQTLNNCQKFNLKASTNYQNEYSSNGSNNQTQNQNRFVSGNKNISYIAAAYSKNGNLKNENYDKNKRLNDFKININNFINAQKSFRKNYEKNKIINSIGCKIKEIEMQEEVQNDAYLNNHKKEQTDIIFSKDKIDEKEVNEKIKKFSKDHFKDLKCI